MKGVSFFDELPGYDRKLPVKHSIRNTLFDSLLLLNLQLCHVLVAFYLLLSNICRKESDLKMDSKGHLKFIPDSIAQNGSQNILPGEQPQNSSACAK